MDSNGLQLDIKFSEVKELTSITLPCLVKDYKKGFEMCGGEELIKHTIKHKSSSMQINLNPQQDPLRRPIIGSKSKSVVLLLKLVRQKAQIDPSGIATESKIAHAEILGKTNTSYCFNELADYQFLSAVTVPQPKIVVDYTTGLMVPPNRHEVTLELIPRPFTKTNLINVTLPIFQDRKHLSLDVRKQRQREKRYVTDFSLTVRKVGMPTPPLILADEELSSSLKESQLSEMINLTNTRKRNLQRKRYVFETLVQLISKVPGNKVFYNNIDINY